MRAAWLSRALIAASLAWSGAAISAEDEGKPVSHPEAQAQVEVTATRFEGDPDDLSTILTVLDGEMLRARGMTDLRSALGVVAGVDVAPGGDNGPRSAVPEMWGLREFDAFLLVVDGVPWGGAFNPELATLSLQDVARIEVMRGSAPVMYGATSFIGVIQVIHNNPGHGHSTVHANGGTHGSYGAGASFDLPNWAGFDSRLAVDAQTQGYPDDRTDWKQGHVLWRNRRPAGKGQVRFDLDLNGLNQSPSSPSVRVGNELSTDVHPDANSNPRNAKLDPRRGTITGGYDAPASFGTWSTTLSYARVAQKAARGFVQDVTFPTAPAVGIRQDTTLDEIYADGHVTLSKMKHWTVVAGADLLWGNGSTSGGDYDYVVNPNTGEGAPDGETAALQSDVHISDKRTFGGLYAFAAWEPQWRWHVEMGARLNLTKEERDARAVEFSTGIPEGGTDSRTETKPAGSVGLAFTAWRDGNDDLRLFAGYKNTFKPAAIDFGLEAEAEILEPEQGQSAEIGARTALFDRRLEIELEAFQMDLKDIVVGENAGGIPGLENGGEQRLRGIELEARGRIVSTLYGRAAWSLHDARFQDFVQDFGGVPTQLAGNRLEMTPRDMAAGGLIWSPEHGFTAHGEVRYTGARYLNRRNTALAPGFTSWSAGIGWRAPKWQARLDAENISNRRDPVSEAELADAQYYRLPARQVWLSFAWNF